MRLFRSIRLAAVAVIGLCMGSALLRAQAAPDSSDATPEANPGRPTVSTPATLTPVGYLQFENGGLYASGSPGLAVQFSLNQVTKLAVASRLQLLSSWEPFARSSGAAATGDSPNQPGGIAVGAQAVVVPGQGVKPTVAVSYFRSLYDGTTPNLDVGSAEQSALVLFSLDYAGFHADINGLVNEQKDSGIRRAQLGQTLSISRNFGKYTVTGELWHFSQPLTQGNAVGNLWALSYTARPNLVFDAGFNRGLTSSSTSWEEFAGFTYLLPHRLWPEHAAHFSHR